MNDNLVCNVCATPGTLADSREHGRVRSNVRAFRHESFTLWRCNSCESLHCKEAVDLAHYYRSYFVHSGKTDAFLRCIFMNRIKQLKRAGWTKAQSVLDYGCASGLFVEHLRAAGVAAEGYDPFTPAWSDAARLNRTYDVVTAYDVIEHDDDPRAMLVRLNKLVRPGGLLLLATPDAAKFTLAQQGLPYAHAPYHRRILSEKALVQLGEAAGLRVRLVEHCEYLKSLWPTFNFRFVASYIEVCGGCSDVVNDPPQIGTFLRTPRLWFDALYGSFFSHGVNMTVAFTVPAAA